MTNKNRNMIIVAVLAITSSTITGILVSTYMQQTASAQYQNRFGYGFPSQNFTGSIRISPTLSQTILSKANVSLSTAATNAEKGVGPNSHAAFAHLGIVNGFLVYTINVIDANHNIHTIIVDAGNGKVLSSQQIPLGSGAEGGMFGQGGMFGERGQMYMNPGGNYFGGMR